METRLQVQSSSLQCSKMILCVRVYTSECVCNKCDCICECLYTCICMCMAVHVCIHRCMAVHVSMCAHVCV